MAKLTNSTIYGSANITGNVVSTGFSFNISANSGLINISNANSVSTVYMTNTGAGYQSVPTISFSNTTTGGVTANANAVMRITGGTYPLGNVGAGYAIGDYLYANVAGALANAVFQVTNNTATTYGVGGISGISVINTGLFFTLPNFTNTSGVLNTGAPAYLQITGNTSVAGVGANIAFAPVSGTGSFVVNNLYFSNYGTGYVEQPTVTFTGGSPSTAATGYAYVGGGTNIKSLGTFLSFYTPAGEGLRIIDPSVTSALTDYIQINGSNFNRPTIYSAGTTGNINLGISSRGTGVIQFFTNTTTQEQFRVTHTASAVNYLNVTGAATGGNVSILAAGSDSNIGLVLQPKGTGALQAQQTDSTATGGNARGANAVDWQTSRAVATSVASGQYSGILSGVNNSVSGFGSVIAGGWNNGMNGGSSAMVGGYSNSAHGPFNFIGGGAYNSGTINSPITTQTVTIAQTSAITLYVSSTNASVKAGQQIIGTGVPSFTYVASAIATGTPAVMATSTITGTTLSVGSLSSGTIVAGQVLTGTGVTAGTYIVSGSGSTWTVSPSQTVTSTTITGTAYTLTTTNAVTIAAGGNMTFYTPHGVVVGGGNNTANGSYSFVGGGGDAGTSGYRNTASGDWSSIVGGQTNYIVSGADYSFIGGGKINKIDASAGNSTIAGGTNNNSQNILNFIGGGTSHIAYSQYGVVGGGFNNSVYFLGSVGGGQYNTASGSYAFVGGGFQCGAQGDSSFVGSGALNFANGKYSAVPAGFRGDSREIKCSLTQGADPFAGNGGTCQWSNHILGNTTSNTSPQILSVDAGLHSTATWNVNFIRLPNNSAYYFNGTVIAAVTAGGNTSAWRIEGVIKRGANAASTTIVGSVTTTLIAQDSGASSWSIAVTADTTNGGLQFTATGAAATTIRWVARVETTEVAYI